MKTRKNWTTVHLILTTYREESTSWEVMHNTTETHFKVYVVTPLEVFANGRHYASRLRWDVEGTDYSFEFFILRAVPPVHWPVAVRRNALLSELGYERDLLYHRLYNSPGFRDFGDAAARARTATHKAFKEAIDFILTDSFWRLG